MRPVQYLLKDEGYGAEIVAGPIPAFDDEQFETVLCSFLRDHPWDDTIQYQILLLDEKAVPSIEDLTSDYLEPLIAEAWGFNLPEEDDEEEGRKPESDSGDKWSDEGGKNWPEVYD